MKIECSYNKLIPLNDLVPHPENENKHSDKQIEILANIIKKDGMRHPIVVSNLSGYVVSGHGRLMALKLLGASEAPVDFQDFEDPIQELRVRTADNQIARYAEFQHDQFKLNLEKYDIDTNEVNFEEFGFVDFTIGHTNQEINNGESISPVDVAGDSINKESFFHSIRREMRRMIDEAIAKGSEEIEASIKIESVILKSIIELNWEKVEDSFNKEEA